MTVSETKVKKYLINIKNNIEYIKSSLNYDNNTIKSNLNKLGSLKYETIILIETYIRLFQHILSHNHNVSVTGMIDTIEKARTYKWINEESFTAIKKLVEIRNTHLICDYNIINEDEFINFLRDDISTLDEIAKYIKNNIKC